MEGLQKVNLFDTVSEKAGRINASNELLVKDSNLSGLEIPAHDYLALSYTGSNLTGVVYKTGGASGTVVATLTLAYSGSNLMSVTKT